MVLAVETVLAVIGVEIVPDDVFVDETVLLDVVPVDVPVGETILVEVIPVDKVVELAVEGKH